MANKIICIGRQYGSGGTEISKLLSKKLNIPFYDKKLIDLASERSGIAKEVFEASEEKKTNPWLYVGMRDANGITKSSLGAPEFVAGALEGSARGIAKFLPAIIFAIAVFLAFATGTSWGTFSILIPIVVDVFPVGSEILIIAISACLAGAVCGDHISPISDTTIMASTGAQCDHLVHVYTQLPYAMTVAAVSFVAYIFAGFIQNVYINLALGVVLMVGTLLVIEKLVKKQAA